MTSQHDAMLDQLEAEQLVDENAQQEELKRSHEVARRQVALQKQDKQATQWRESMARRREELKERWEHLEERRRLRMQYYYAKMQRSRQNGSNEDGETTTDDDKANVEP